jgi:hypothetical protein
MKARNKGGGEKRKASERNDTRDNDREAKLASAYAYVYNFNCGANCTREIRANLQSAVACCRINSANVTILCWI